MKIWKKNAVVATVILFVCVAVYLNWSYNRDDTTVDLDTTLEDMGAGKILGDATFVDNTNPDDTDAGVQGDGQTGQQSASSSYFSQARLSRQQARDSAIAILQQAAGQDSATQETIDKANDEIQVMATNAIKEASIETLVMAKGFTECVAIVNADGINVVVSEPDGGLQSSDVAKITDIVTSETAFSAQQIRITGA